MHPLVILAAFAIGLATFLTSILLPFRRMWLTARNMPGPRGYPLIGNAFEMLGDEHHVLKEFIRNHNEYGMLYRFWAGPKLVIVVHDPADIQEVLGSPQVINKDSMMTNALSIFLGVGLLSLRNEMWRVHRKIITPIFHFKILQTYVEVFERKANMMCDKLENLIANSSTINIHEQLVKSTLASISETAIGIPSGTEKEIHENIYKCICRGNEIVHEIVTHPWLSIGWVLPLTAVGRETDKLRKTLHGFIDKIIKKKLHEHVQQKMHPSGLQQDCKEGRGKIRTLLELLIESADNKDSVMSVQEIKDELSTIFIAGTDTTAIGISNLCLLIGLNPLVQDNISKELDDIFNGDLRAATTDDVNRMVYLEAVLKETLRLLPVAPLLSREIATDIHLPSGYILPAGCSAVTLSYMVHRDPRYFTEPDRFSPERWLPDPNGGAMKTRHAYSYLPFGAGLRNCVGQKYAMLQMKIIASSLLRRFTVSHDFVEADLKFFGVSVTMEFGKEYMMTLKKK